jgi:transcription antitermination factor NusG
MDSTVSRPWFAVRVRSKSEVLVSSVLQKKGIESFAPTYPVTKRYSNKLRKLQSALFPGYVFCRFDPSDTLPVVTTPAVQEVVTFGSGPAPISESEIADIRRTVQYGEQLAPWPYLDRGQRVRVVQGALSGVEGILVTFKNAHRLVISTELLKQAVSLEIETGQIAPI